MPYTDNVSDEQLTSTGFKRIRKLRSMITRPAPVLRDMEKFAKVDVEGGEKVIVEWKYRRHSASTRLVSGYETIPLNAQKVLTHGHDGWMDVIRPVVLSGHERRKNRGDAKIIDLWKTRMEDTEEGARLEFEEHLFKANQAALADLNHFNGTDFTDGFIEENPVGSQTNTVHSLSKQTYQSKLWFQNQVGDAAGNASANLLNVLYAGFLQIGTLTDDMSSCIGYGHTSALGELKEAIQTNERYVSEKDLDGGRKVLTYQGYPIRPTRVMPDDGATTGNADDDNDKPWSFLFLDWSRLSYQAQKGAYFKFGEARTLEQQDVTVALMNNMGQLIAEGGFGSHLLIVDANK